MWLNQQTRDAVRMMVVLAGRWPHLLRAVDLSQQTGITLTNVQKTAYALGQAELIVTLRGRHGGLRLARPAEEISIGEIVRAFEPKDCPASFLAACPGDSVLSRLMFRAHRGFFQPLEETSLAVLVQEITSSAPHQA